MSTQNIFGMTDTWNAGGTTFTAIGMNVTDTASAAGSLLIDLQVDGVSQFRASKSGVVVVPLSANSTTPSYAFDGGKAGLGYMGSTLRFVGNNNNLWVNLGDQFLQIIGTNAQVFLSTDVTLIRDAANALAQRNATNTQTQRVYSTHTSATNFQRLAITSARTTLSALSGANATATNLIPKGAVVVGVTSRVITELTGATGYLIGTAGDTDRWGDVTGVSVGTDTDNVDWTSGTIECFTAATSVVVTAKTSNFTAGAIEIAVHYLAGEAD